MKTIIVLVYLAIGVAVATVKDYLGDIGNVGDVINLVLAVILWPLVLLGVDFELDIGGDDGDKGDKDKGGKDGGKGEKNGALFLFGPAVSYAYALASRTARRATAPS
jgi:hypothetical protein